MKITVDSSVVEGNDSQVGVCIATEMKMQRVVVTIVSLLAVLGHIEAGCCAHHVHAGQSSQPVAACHSHRGSDHQHQHQAPPTRPTSHDDCHETHCEMTLASGTSVGPMTGLGWWLPRLAAGDELTSGASWQGPAGQPVDAACPLPLRAHLLLGVMLI
jgi:hypothetical protein